MFEKVPADMNFAEREKDVLKFWSENEIFKKSVKNREGSTPFVFFEGPPTANGMPHIGHVITRAMKDVVPRYQTMKGRLVTRKGGWDTHGLPVELEVEKVLGINGKQDIEKYGVEPFIQKCKESVWKYEKEWRDMSERVGFWADMDDPYVTFHNEYIQSVWWALKQIWDKGLMYKGHKVVPYCPRCGTALSSHEVAQGYRDVTENSIYTAFKHKNEENTFFLVWTTTPWTLPSNVALAVNAKHTYVKIKTESGRVYILAEALLESVVTEKHEVIARLTGKELEYTEYEPLFDYEKPDKKAFYVVCDDYVVLTDGTGIVHIAPAFGEDDARIGRAYDLPLINLANAQGCFSEKAELCAGIFVKDADPAIIKDLETRELLHKVVPYEHSYPFCWRCDTPLLYYARESWFIKMTAVKDRLLALNNEINWIPDNIRTGRFGSWLENVIDWAFSRERYWGTPVPLWECENKHIHAVGSIAELKELACAEDKDKIDTLELHKPYIDEITLVCPQCGKNMKRVPEVVDCWFDSGSMPFAQWHYPFANEDTFKKNFPADFISEAVDQTRGWFYSLLAISTLLFDESPYKNVIVLGHIQDKNGQKMSKSKGNMLDPKLILNKQGADATRWYFYTFGSPWLSNRFNEDALDEAQRKFMGTLWNAYAFFVLYANIDGFDPTKYELGDSLPVMDKWALSRLNTLIKTVDAHLSAYRVTEAARALNDFTDELSNWYIRRCRERFWESGMERDKIDAYMTLYTVLTSVSRLAAPFVPFMTENMYQNLVAGVDKSAPESVHLCDYPVCDDTLIDTELETHMDGVLKIVERGRAARNAASVKNRQPLETIYVKSDFSLPEEYHTIILDELNIKNIAFTDDVERFAAYSFKPQLKTLGKKYGKLIPSISKALAEGDGAAYHNALKSGPLTLSVDGAEVVLAEEDLLIEISQMPGFAADSDRGVTVVLDVNLTAELIEEGLVREVVSKLQNMRKEAGFEVMDKISVCFAADTPLADVIHKNADKIKTEVLADEILQSDGQSNPGFTKEWSINGESAILSVSKK